MENMPYPCKLVSGGCGGCPPPGSCGQTRVLAVKVLLPVKRLPGNPCPGTASRGIFGPAL